MRCYGWVLPFGIFGKTVANDGGEYNEALRRCRAREQPNGIREWWYETYI
jgi:hypothetical protein